MDYVDWFNHRRLYEACGDISPAELETAYYSHNASLAGRVEIGDHVVLGGYTLVYQWCRLGAHAFSLHGAA